MIEYLVYPYREEVKVKEGFKEHRKNSYKDQNVFRIFENNKNTGKWVTTCPDKKMTLSKKGRVWCTNKEDVKTAKEMVSGYIKSKRNSDYYIQKNALETVRILKSYLKSDEIQKIMTGPYEIGKRNMARFVLCLLTGEEQKYETYGDVKEC